MNKPQRKNTINKNGGGFLMHTMWKGSISFGLVNIPIKLHAATEDKDIKLRNLHSKCHSPIKYEKVCPVCDEPVEQSDIVKAYEYTKGKFIVLDEEELQALKKENEDKAVEILDFVKINEVDPIYFSRSYYISPGDSGSKAYALLREALKESEKVGIAKIIIRAKEQLALLRVFHNTLVMETIHFPDEVRNFADVPNIPAEEKIAKKELDTALLLIDQLTTTFEPEKYTDEYRQALLELIETKKNGEEVVITNQQQPKTSNVTDLMAALQASIDQTKPTQPKKEKTTTKSKKKKSTSATKTKKEA